MSLKSERNDKVERSYPWIGISDLDIIILFTSPGKGVVLSQSDYKFSGNHEIGHYVGSVAEHRFTLYSGSVTLSN